MTFAEKPQTKLFGVDAARVSTPELHAVYQELKDIFQSDFGRFELSAFLSSKMDHGDIDILVLSSPELNVKSLIDNKLGEKILKISRNDSTWSFLFDSNIGKKVHIDFICSTSEDKHLTKMQYYSLNDFSAVIGTVSKKLNFKYGSEYFAKRFVDKRSIWHDIPLTQDLMTGLAILGFDVSQYGNIHTRDDIVSFMANNPLVDSSFFERDILSSADRQAYGKRQGVKYILDKLRGMDLKRKIHDEDYFLKQYPDLYQKVIDKIQQLNKEVYLQSAKFGGTWIMETFHLSPSPQIGTILKGLYLQFGDKLEEQPEEIVQAAVNLLLKK